MRIERTQAADPDRYAAIVEMTESPQFPSLVIDALSKDPGLLARSGQVAYVTELSEELGVVDIEGKQPSSPRKTLGAPTVYSSAVVE